MMMKAGDQHWDICRDRLTSERWGHAILLAVWQPQSIRNHSPLSHNITEIFDDFVASSERTRK